MWKILLLFSPAEIRKSNYRENLKHKLIVKEKIMDILNIIKQPMLISKVTVVNQPCYSRNYAYSV